MKILYSKKDKKSEFSYIAFIVFTGFAFENQKEKGIAHLLEHIVAKGSTFYKNHFTLFSEINSKGIKFNASTSDFFTTYYMDCSNSHMSDAIDLLSKIVFYPNINQNDLKIEKKIVVNELNERISNPESFTFNQSLSKIYKKDNPFYLDDFEEIKNVVNFSFNDVQSFYNKYYTINNCAFYSSSSIPKDKIKKYFNNTFNKYKEDINNRQANKVNTFFYYNKLLPKMHLINNFQKQISFEKYFKKNRSSFLYFLQLIPFEISSKEFAALFILKNFFASTLTSFLFMELREKRQLVYTPRTDIDFSSNVSSFTINMFCEKNNRTKIIKKIKEYINKFKTELVPTKEFNKFKTVSYYMVKRLKLQDFYKMDLMISKYFFKNVNNITSDLWINYINKINRSDIKNVVNRYFDEKKFYIFMT